MSYQRNFDLQDALGTLISHYQTRSTQRHKAELAVLTDLVDLARQDTSTGLGAIYAKELERTRTHLSEIPGIEDAPSMLARTNAARVIRNLYFDPATHDVAREEILRLVKIKQERFSPSH